MASLEQHLPHVAMVTSPGMGHLIPFVELANRLVTHHGMGITLFIPTLPSLSQAQNSLLQTLPSSISYVVLPQPDMSDISLQNSKMETLVVLTVIRSQHLIRQQLKMIVASGRRLVAIVADFFAVDSFELAKEFNAAAYMFFVSGAVLLHVFFNRHKLDAMEELDDLIELPGCIPIPKGDMTDSILDRKNDANKWLLNIAKKFHQADGILLNSFRDLENESIAAFQSLKTPPVYAVGPLISMSCGANKRTEECLEWLENQPQSSVLYVSFGSGGTLSFEQITELAMGLEMSKVRFIWVARCPSSGEANSAYFSVQSERDPLYFLPDGFINRTKQRGVIVDSWAPQTEILRHGSTGGFLSHCGWNSVLESVVNGVPLIAWPLFADQKMNAHTMSLGVGIALRLRGDLETGVVGRDEICSVVMDLMEGDGGQKVRKRMSYLKNGAARALSKDSSSNQSLSKVAAQLSSQLNLRKI